VDKPLTDPKPPYRYIPSRPGPQRCLVAPVTRDAAGTTPNDHGRGGEAGAPLQHPGPPADTPFRRTHEAHIGATYWPVVATRVLGAEDFATRLASTGLVTIMRSRTAQAKND
jgi:hypothetical protein